MFKFLGDMLLVYLTKRHVCQQKEKRYTLTVPSWIVKQIPIDTAFSAELTEEGILYRQIQPVEVSCEHTG